MASILIPSPSDIMQHAVLRGLGRRGHHCEVAWSADQHSGWMRSRYCSAEHAVPSANADPIGYAQAVLALCRRHHFDVVMPSSASSLEALLPVAEDLAELSNILFPSSQHFAMGMDKIQTLRMCEKYGFHSPASVVLNETVDLQAEAARLGYPLVVKHRRNFGGSYGVRIVAAAEQLAETVAELTALQGNGGDVLLQQFLPGTLFDVCVVAAQGEIACLASQARRLMYPISGGVAATLVTVDHALLTQQAKAIVEALQWTGPLQLEFKWDAGANQFALIEINPRFWGTTGAWLKAGANFAAAAADLALGIKPPPLQKLPADLRYRYFVGRSCYALVQLARLGGMAALRDPLRYQRTWYDLDIMDPLPDLLRVYVEFRVMLRGQRRWGDHSLPAELIPALNASLDTPLDTSA